MLAFIQVETAPKLHQNKPERSNRVPSCSVRVPSVPTQFHHRSEAFINTSLTKFCKDANLPKSSVYRRCQELSIDTSVGLTPSDCDRLLHEFDRLQVDPAAALMEVGNHQIVFIVPY